MHGLDREGRLKPNMLALVNPSALSRIRNRGDHGANSPALSF